MTTAATPGPVPPMATKIASSTSTRHMPSAMLMNDQRLPNLSIVYHGMNDARMYQTWSQQPTNKASSLEKPRLDLKSVGA